MNASMELPRSYDWEKQPPRHQEKKHICLRVLHLHPHKGFFLVNSLIYTRISVIILPNELQSYG